MLQDLSEIEPERIQDGIWQSGQEVTCRILHDCRSEVRLGTVQEQSRIDIA